MPPSRCRRRPPPTFQQGVLPRGETSLVPFPWPLPLPFTLQLDTTGRSFYDRAPRGFNSGFDSGYMPWLQHRGELLQQLEQRRRETERPPELRHCNIALALELRPG